MRPMPGPEAGLTWVLDALRRGEDLTFDDVAEAYDTSDWDPQWSLEREHEDFLRSAEQLGAFEVRAVEPTGDDQHSARLVGHDGKQWAVTCWASPAPPHKITGVRIVPAPPDGTVIRDAVEEDGPALAELERRSPLRLGEGGAVKVTFDRGDDYFRSARLMGDVTVYAAEVDGALAGVYWGAQQPVRVGGVDYRIFLEMHVRIDPEAPRGGVFWALCVYGRDTYARTSDSIAFWVSPENLAVRKFVADVPAWSIRGLRALIPCDAAAAAGDGDGDGRWATRDDAAAVAEVLNASHGRSELYVPYTDASLAERLARDPAQYGWGNVRMLGDAVVAVGGDRLGVTRDVDGTRVESRRAHVLDHGFRPGGEDDYRRLLRWWAGSLAAEGVTHLAVFTSQGSPTHDVVIDLAGGVEEYDLWTFAIAEPDGTPERGLYVDPVYF